MEINKQNEELEQEKALEQQDCSRQNPGQDQNQWQGQDPYQNQNQWQGQDPYQNQNQWQGQDSYQNYNMYGQNNRYNNREYQCGDPSKISEVPRNLLLVIFPLQVIVAFITIGPFVASVKQTLPEITNIMSLSAKMIYTPDFIIWNRFLNVVAIIMYGAFVFDLYKLKKAGYKIGAATIFAIICPKLYLLWRNHLLGRKMKGIAIYTIMVVVLDIVATIIKVSLVMNVIMTSYQNLLVS